MVLRRGGRDRLQRPCKSCSEYFVPSGKGVKVCNDCCTKTSTVMSNLVKLQRKINNKQKVIIK